MPDAFIVLDFMLHEMADILYRLVVHADRMLENLELTNGLIYSQPVLLALIDAGMDRQEAYKLVQAHAQQSLSGGPKFKEALGADPSITAWITNQELSSLFDPETQLRSIGAIFNRLGLVQDENEARRGDSVAPA